MFANLHLYLHIHLFAHTHGLHDPTPMVDASNIVVWKTRMSIYLQTLGLHVFLAATKKCYLGNSNHIGANTQTLEAIRSTLSKDYLIHVSNIDSAFVVWNMLTTTTSKLQMPIQQEESLVENPSLNAIWSKGMTPLRYIQNPN